MPLPCTAGDGRIAPAPFNVKGSTVNPKPVSIALVASIALVISIMALLAQLATSVRAGDDSDALGEDSGATQTAAVLVRQPYLQQLTTESVTIMWATREAGVAEVRFQPASGGEIRSVAAASTLFAATVTGMTADYYQHQATLPGLDSGTAYRYDILVDGIDLNPDPDEFTTPPPSGTGSVSFVVFGDSGSGTTSQRKLAELMAADFRSDRWDLAIHTGDIVYPSGTFRWLHDRFFAVYHEWLRRKPIYFGVGNHEYYAQDARPYLDLFAMPTNAYHPAFPNHVERYYSFDHGPIHFVSLNTNGMSSGPGRQQQLDWLVRDLEATTQPWRIVFMHIPAYGSSDWSSTFSLRNNLQAIFERYGVQLVLAGHEHDYARGAPWFEQPTSYSPVMHVVSGGGGAGLNNPQPGPWLVNWASAYHYLSVDISDCDSASPCELSLQAIGIDGRPFDSFTLKARQQRDDSAMPVVSWILPATDMTVSGQTTLSANAIDDQAIVKVDLLVDGELRLVDKDAPYGWTWNTNLELNGVRSLQLRATDIAGNIVLSDVRTLRVSNALPTLRLLSPAASERVYTTLPYRIRWAAAAGAHALSGFQVYSAPDGKTFTAVPGCESLPATARECTWSAPGPVSTKTVVRVFGFDAQGTAVIRTSPAFRILTGTPGVTLRFPDKVTSVAVGSSQQIQWSSGLGSSPLRLEVTYDGGASWETLAASLTPLIDSYRWVVREAGSSTLVRVSSLNTGLQDVSSVPFASTAPAMAFANITAATTWQSDTAVTVKWTTNLGFHDRFNLRLSIDGGQSFPIVLAGGLSATARSAKVTVPLVATTRARLMLESLSNPAWRTVNGANFTIVVP
jgi:hypothetical protein